MDLKAAVVVAKQQIIDLFAPKTPQNVRVEEFLYDDHLGVWSLTVGFALSERAEGASAQTRHYKIVRVSEVNKSVLSVKDR